jgi:hypothetical protein
VLRIAYVLMFFLASGVTVAAPVEGVPAGTAGRDPGADYFADAVPDPELPGTTTEGFGTVVHSAADAVDTATADAYSEAVAVPDAKQIAALKKQVATAYKPLFYDNNFRYINSPLYEDRYLGDYFKQMPIGEGWMVDFGGQYRSRYMGEQNMRGLGLTGRDDQFLLHRWRLFANAKYGDWLRAYVEYIDAQSNYENFPIRIIEENRSDLLNLFVDARLINGSAGDLWCRVGRQELLYGSERLISPLDWANTRRTFEGIKFMWQAQDWNVDFFATRPVYPNPTHFDSPNYAEEFFGSWATYKGIPNETIDLFALQYNSDRGLNNFRYTSLGGRWLGSNGPLLWEAEGGVQFGRNTDGSDHGAGFLTGGVGRKWEDHDWKPQLMCYYDWANGSDDRGAGNGFNQLFPLAHKYLGFMDLFGRSNIESPNVQLTMQPHQKVKLLVWYYYLFLQNGNDTPYSVVMTPFNRTNAPASRDLGQEIDLLATVALNPRMDVVLGYSHFFAGNYYKLTPGVPYRDDANFYYVQFQWNF